MIWIWMSAAQIVRSQRLSLMRYSVAIEIRRILDRVGVRMPAEQMVEAAILHHHHDDVLQAAVVRPRQAPGVSQGGRARPDQAAGAEKRGSGNTSNRLEKLSSSEFHGSPYRWRFGLNPRRWHRGNQSLSNKSVNPL